MRDLALLGALAAVACGARPTPAPPLPTPVVRGAAGDTDLRSMLVEIASAKACAMVEHQFRALRNKDEATGRPVNGIVWLRDCRLGPSGTQLVVDVTGSGWSWTDRETKKAGATFGVHQYVKFDLRARMVGAVDVAFDPETHVASMWFTPTSEPDVSLKPIGDVDVDREGVWSDVVGFIGGVVGQSPNRKGRAQASDEGTRNTIEQLARGLTVTMNLCNGLSHMMLGRLPRGIYGPAGAGETRRVPIELHAGGVMVFPPQHAAEGLSIDVDSKGPVHVGLACRDEGEAAAAAFLAGKPVEPSFLADKIVSGTDKIAIGPQHCPVTVIALSAAPATVTFDFERPLAESERATAGPLIRCAK